MTIRFKLPAGLALSDLPLGPSSSSAELVDDDHVEVHTEDELQVLHDLTGWALEGGHALAGLSVLRVSLEDIYLGLTETPKRETSDSAAGVTQ